VGLFAALFAILLMARLCHTDILWADEDYHQAAAIQLLHGKVLYRDLWYDKPPLNAAAYLLFGAAGGGVLRTASAIYALLVCWSAYCFAKNVWSEREGRIAAALAAFGLIFYFPPATITLEPDTLLILPHFWAVYFAWRKRYFLAGTIAGLAMLLNVKALFVLAACAPLEWTPLGMLLLGFLIPNAAGALLLAGLGAAAGYLDQVWGWGWLYVNMPASSETAPAMLFTHPLLLLTRLMPLANWSGFHAALIVGAFWCCWKEPETRLRWIGWTLICFGGVMIGWRFPPRYMNQLLPPLTLAASRGFALAFSEKRRILQALLVAALLIPAIRFGPRYAMLAAESLRGMPHNWIDTAMDRDSRAAAAIVSRLASPGATLVVWGYRPNIYVYTRLAAGSRYWDSQPLTGVPASRHLFDDHPVAMDWAAENRAEFARSRPDFLADGLSLYNPRLDIHRYPDLRQWLSQYCEVGRSAATIVYRRCGNP